MEEQISLLCAALETHVTTLRALVVASQRQQQAILGVRLSGAETVGTLNELTEEIRDLNDALARSQGEVDLLFDTVATELGVPLEPRSLTAVIAALPTDLAGALELQVSCIKSLTAALSELHRLNAAYAQRGLQLLDAYRTLVQGDEPQTERAYTARARARTRATSSLLVRA